MLRVIDIDTHAFVTLRRRARSTQQHLTAHPEVGDDRTTGRSGCRSQRHPQELPAPRHTRHPSTHQLAFERDGVAVVASQRSRVPRIDPDDAGAGKRRGESSADDFDFGKLRHDR